MAFDIYAAVTDRIISELEQGIIPWQKPWIASAACVSHATGKPYSLLNQMMLRKLAAVVPVSEPQGEGL